VGSSPLQHVAKSRLVNVLAKISSPTDTNISLGPLNSSSGDCQQLVLWDLRCFTDGGVELKFGGCRIVQYIGTYLDSDDNLIQIINDLLQKLQSSVHCSDRVTAGKALTPL
jgi:hypothetical protein